MNLKGRWKYPVYKRILFALDLEGVNNVVGEPYNTLARDTEQWQIARAQAVLEVNAAADALFEVGVEKIGLWDNHSRGCNVERALLDPRITWIPIDNSLPRMYFADGEYDCICFFGYHAMEGTLGGVLAHTMSSVRVQHYKLNGRYIGEVDIDAHIAAEKGIPSVFFSGGDIACRQARQSLEGIATVATKQELARNKAIFRDNEALLTDIRETIARAVTVSAPLHTLCYPCVWEKSFKRVEDAQAYLARVRACGICADHPDDDRLGKDAHTVVSTLHSITDLIACI